MGPEELRLTDSIQRGYFRPREERRLVEWFAQLLTVRAGLFEVVEEVANLFGDRFELRQSREEWRCFLPGYAAVCLVVALDRHLVEEVACHSLVQRKLNEGSLLHRIPRKHLTSVFKSLADPVGAYRLRRAMRHLEAHRELVESMASDRVVGEFVSQLSALERSLDPSKRRFLKLLRSYRRHSLRRRGASAKQKTVLGTLEQSGRLASELRLRKPKRVPQQAELLRSLLRPGDVLVTRHDQALTNLFLPGYWPHAALYFGTPEEWRTLGLLSDEADDFAAPDGHEVLEALKDGVLFRPLEETLAVDAVAILRPAAPPELIARALRRAQEHEGKLYNFDFDFFRADRLVCTEVVYRAFDGLGPMRFELQERSGRPTLSAEDLLDMALDTPQFEPVAVFGAPGCEDRVVTGSECVSVLEGTYRGVE